MPWTTHVIVGGGLAGAQGGRDAARGGLRRAASSWSADEPEAPYERPPLSKELPARAATSARKPACTTPAGTTEHDVELRTGVRAAGLDPAGRTAVELDTGEELPYDRLLLATGSSPRRLPLPGADLDGVPLPAHAAPTPTGCGPSSPPAAAGWSSSARAGSGSRWPPRPAATATRSRSSSRSPRRCSGARPGDGRGVRRLHREHGVDLRTGTGVRELRGDRGRVRGRGHRRRHRARPPTSSSSASARTPTPRSPRPPASRSTTASSPTPRLRTSAPGRVRRRRRRAAPSTRCYGRHVRVEHWANALQRRPGRGPVDARPGGLLRPGAVLLHRPVRPRHGVLGARPAAGDAVVTRGDVGRPGVHRVLARRRPGAWPA